MQNKGTVKAGPVTSGSKPSAASTTSTAGAPGTMLVPPMPPEGSHYGVGKEEPTKRDATSLGFSIPKEEASEGIELGGASEPSRRVNVGEATVDPKSDLAKLVSEGPASEPQEFSGTIQEIDMVALYDAIVSDDSDNLYETSQGLPWIVAHAEINEDALYFSIVRIKNMLVGVLVETISFIGGVPFSSTQFVAGVSFNYSFGEASGGKQFVSGVFIRKI